jgi:hypothetical protein
MRSVIVSRDRRALAAGVVVVLLLVTFARGLPALRLWRADVRDSSAALTQEATRARMTVARERTTRDSLAARERRFIALAPLLLRGETPAMGSATLASLISTAATAASVRLGPVQVQADTVARGVFTRVGVRAEITGDVRGVSTFLSTLERGPTLVSVKELTIAQLEPAAAADRAEALHVTVAVEALMVRRRPANAVETARDSTSSRRTP